MNELKLIVTICNDGFSEEVMEAATDAGAKGGTVMHARSSAIHEETKFFGITIHPEKDVILIVTEKDKINDIIKAISNKHGVGTKAHALSFTLPIEDAIGFNF